MLTRICYKFDRSWCTHPTRSWLTQLQQPLQRINLNLKNPLITKLQYSPLLQRNLLILLQLNKTSSLTTVRIIPSLVFVLKLSVNSIKFLIFLEWEICTNRMGSNGLRVRIEGFSFVDILLHTVHNLECDGLLVVDLGNFKFIITNF